MIASAVAAFFCSRVIVLMLLREPMADGPPVAVPSVRTTSAITAGVLVTITGLGVASQRRSACWTW
jgi:NADH-quinone oxidoreductase subunit N